MQITKLKISEDASSKLRSLRNKTSLTPNLLCRMALATSLEMGALRTDEIGSANERGQEFNAYTLFGADQAVLISMMRLVEFDGKLEKSPADAISRICGHIDRGVSQLAVRIKSPADAAQLLSGMEA